MAAVKRLKRELEDIVQEQDSLCTAGPVGDDLFHWEARLTGPPDSPYDGGCFRLDIAFPANYPASPPKVRFVTRIFHPNVDLRGQVCIDILHSGMWQPHCTVRLLLLSLLPLLAEPSPAYALNKAAASGLNRTPSALSDAPSGGPPQALPAPTEPREGLAPGPRAGTASAA